MGYSTKKRQRVPTKSGATAEIDLLVTRGNRTMAVECKNYDESRSVPVKDLRIFANKLDDSSIISGVFVASTVFSMDAQKFAESEGRIDLWDRAKLFEMISTYMIGRIGLSSLRKEQVLPVMSDFESISGLPLSNRHVVNLYSKVLLYHPYIAVGYRLQSTRKDPTGRRHMISDSGIYIVDGLDGDIINKESGILEILTGGLLMNKVQRVESKEDKLVTKDLLSMKSGSENIMKTSDYNLTFAEQSISEKEAVEGVKEYVIVKNTKDVEYNMKVREEIETRKMRIVPKNSEVVIRSVRLVYVPKWQLDYEVGQRSYQRTIIASSGSIVREDFAKCLQCKLMKKSPISACESCGLLLCEKHSFQEGGRYLCQEHVSESMREQIKKKGILSKIGLR